MFADTGNLSAFSNSWNIFSLTFTFFGFVLHKNEVMPPKKKAVEEEKPVIMGRVGTNLKVGIVGLPNVGYAFHPVQYFFFSMEDVMNKCV